MPVTQQPTTRRPGARTDLGRRVLVIDTDRFLAEMARRQLTTDNDIAVFLDTARTTIGRLRGGKTVPSNEFLASCVDQGINPLTFLAVERRNRQQRAA